VGSLKVSPIREHEPKSRSTAEKYSRLGNEKHLKPSNCSTICYKWTLERRRK
jgi:hypothetical protein